MMLSTLATPNSPNRFKPYIATAMFRGEPQGPMKERLPETARDSLGVVRTNISGRTATGGYLRTL
jgi:hypothetical protein